MGNTPWSQLDRWCWTATPRTTFQRLSRLLSHRPTWCLASRLPQTRCCRYLGGDVVVQDYTFVTQLTDNISLPCAAHWGKGGLLLDWYVTCHPPIAVITVEPAVQQFLGESKAFGSSFWRESVYVSSILTFWAILLYFWLILLIVRYCTTYGCSNRSNKVGWENLLWHKHRSKHHFQINVIWRGQAPLNIWICSSWEKYAFGGMFPPYYLLEFTIFTVDHDPNASLSCTFTWKLLNCGLNCNNCY